MHIETSGVNTGKAYTWTAIHTHTADLIVSGADFLHEAAVGDVSVFGIGSGGQITLAAHLDAYGLTIHRDVHSAAGAENEAGANLRLWRDVTGVGTEAGNFLECTTDGTTPVFRVASNGDLVLDESSRLGLVGGTLSARNVDDTLYAPFRALLLRAVGGRVECVAVHPDASNGGVLTIGVDTRSTDAAVGTVTVGGNAARASATVNKVGGLLDIFGGTGDGAIGQEDADGGQLLLHGGAAASDLDNSDGGDVLIYGGVLGTNGVPGVDGIVRICDADGATNICVFGTETTALSITPVAITGKKGSIFTLGIAQQTTDTGTWTYNIVGQQASATATGSNMIGGHVDIVGGQGDGGGAAGAYGGTVSVHGGDADPGIDSSDGGDVKIYGGTLGSAGTPGSDGAVRICDADGNTNVIKVLNGVTQVGAPDGANHLDIAIDGTLTLAGTARVTKKFIIPLADLSVGGTKPDSAIVGNYHGYSYDINDDSVFTTEIPPDWATGTDIKIEIDWYINEAYGGGAEVEWTCAWSAVPHDGSEAVDGPTHSGSDDTGDVNIPATANGLVESTVVTIPGGSLAVGDELGLTISRTAIAGGTPNPTADPVITNLYLKYTADKLGA